jgi:ribosome-binding protein aMBF1 (putative translation factor)
VIRRGYFVADDSLRCGQRPILDGKKKKRNRGYAFLIAKSGESGKWAGTFKTAGWARVARQHPGEEPEGGEPASRELQVAFGRSLRAARRASGLTQIQFGERVGLSQSHVSRIERGERNLTIRAMAVLAAAVGYKLTITLDREVRLDSNNAV